MIKRLLFLLLAALPALAGAAPIKRVTAARAASLQPQRAADHIVVKFKPQAAAAAMAAYGVRAQAAVPGIGATLVTIPAGMTPEAFIARLKAERPNDLDYAEPDYLAYAAHTPNDPDYPSQWHLPKIQCPAAWDTTTGSGVIIAIADTGVEPHPDLSAHLAAGFNVADLNTNTADTVGHGTWVAGTAAAVGDNVVDVTGAAYNSAILPVKISDTGSAFYSTIAAGIEYAADHGAKVVNVSFAGTSCFPQVISDAGAYVRAKGGLLVMAAGNDGINKGCSDDPNIIEVSATDSNDQLASFSSYGNQIDVSAPGVGILTTDMGGGEATVDGTSFASPLTAAALALIFSAAPNLTPDQAQQVLFDSADDLGAPGRDSSFGHGRINANRAIQIATGRSITLQASQLTNVYAYPNPWDTRANLPRQITINNVPDGSSVSIFALSGFWVTDLSPSNGRAVWDLNNSAGSHAASGLYFYLVKTSGGQKARGTIAIIK